MRIVYLLTWGKIDGGLRVVCEHVNRLIERGHEVKVVTQKKEKPIFPMKGELICTSNLRDAIPPDAEILVATYAVSAFYAAESNSAIPFYLVQGYEGALYGKEEAKKLCEESYQLPLSLISVSSFVMKFLKERFNRSSYLIHNGVDTGLFKPIGEKKGKRVLMQYNKAELKDPISGVKALGLVKKMLPDVEIILFGADLPPATNFPYIFFHNPPQEELIALYSSSTIFVSSSLMEGFGLPILEAMACKTAVVTTDSGGIKDFAEDRKTALVVPPKEPHKLALAIVELLENESLRQYLIEEAYEKVKEFEWENSINLLEHIFIQALKRYSERPKEKWSKWERALIVNSDDPFAKYNFGVELYKEGSLRRAKQEFEEAIERAPDFPLPYRELGKVLSELGKHKESKEILEIGIKKFRLKEKG